jgi:hypothetical protein
MIKAQCHTNIDKFKLETWPGEFAGMPRIGEWVESESGKLLKIVSITHAQRFRHHLGSEAYIKVELHLIYGTLADL